MMRRRHDWPERLAELVAARQATPFAWGAFDCATFAADCVAAMTDVDPLAELRGRWRSARGAATAINRAGGLEAALTARLGAPIPPLTARRGDVALAIQDGRPLLAVCLGEYLVAPGPAGLEAIAITAASAAWRV